jgi:hypothetical protein
MVTSFFIKQGRVDVRTVGDPKSASPVVRKARVSSAFE